MVDDAAAMLWTDYQRFGGPSGLGYPISQRYVTADSGAAVQVFQNHAGEEASDLYYWASTLLRDPQTWRAIKAGVRYFGDETMFHLLEQLENVLEARLQQGATHQRDPLPWDFDEDAELFTSMSQLNAAFHAIAPTTLRLMGEYIRKNPSEFVLIEEES